MADRVQRRASRALTWMAVMFGSALGGFPSLSFPLLDLAYYLPPDPPAILPVMIWPLVPVRFAVGLLFPAHLWVEGAHQPLALESDAAAAPTA